MSILVTGGAGFVGSHLVDYLLETTAADVTVLDDLSTGSRTNLSHHRDNERLRLEIGDVRDRETVDRLVATADKVYHLAAAVGVKRVTDRPLESFFINLEGTERIFEAAAADGTPVFLASSSEVYGKNPKVPFKEDDDRVIGQPDALRWGYATAKSADEFLAFTYHRNHDLPVVVGRFFNVVGPRQVGEYGMVIPRFIQQALGDEPITIYGDGTQTRSFLHVEDAVRAVHGLVEAPGTDGEVYNIGSEKPVTINELAETIVSLTGSESELSHVPFEEVYGPDFEEPTNRQADISKIVDAIGWEPERRFRSIISDVIEDHGVADRRGHQGP